MLVDILNSIFADECNYKKINKSSKIKLRSNKDGISLNDIFYYRFLYSKKDTKKQQIVSDINHKNNTSFTRQSFDGKENNVPVNAYERILKKVFDYYNTNNETNIKVIAIDGTYNNDSCMNEILNMGFFNVTDNVPIDIKSYGKENKNREIFSATEYIKKNTYRFENNIIVADRAYYSFDFLKFLSDNGIKFIVRAKGSADNLNPSIELPKKTQKYGIIMDLRKTIRIIKNGDVLKKTIFSNKTKKELETNEIEIKNNCVLITNLVDETLYTDDKIMELYKSRWDIEIFFKHIKNNFKFQHMKEKSSVNYQKMYICELVIILIAKLIENYYRSKFNVKKSDNNIKYQINNSILIGGIYNTIIYNVINSSLTDELLNKFCTLYVKIIQNKKNRVFPRNSKTPFTKWYVKGYANSTKFIKILNAIKNNKVNELNKNLKIIAKCIISIDGKSV